MNFTQGCRQILDECDFSEKDYRFIEEILIDHPPKQIISVVRGKDPKGKHEDFEWFLPLFEKYAPGHGDNMPIEMDEWFWKAYDYLAQFVEEDFYYTDLEFVSYMSMNLDLLKMAITKSKPNIKYVWKVYKSLEQEMPETNKVEFEIKKHGVKTSK